MPIPHRKQKAISFTSILSAEELISFINKNLTDFPEIAFPIKIERIKKRLINIYFPQLTRSPHEELLAEIASNDFLEQEYPKICSVLKTIFSTSLEKLKIELQLLSNLTIPADWSLSPKAATLKLAETQEKYGAWFPINDRVIEVYSRLVESGRRVVLFIEQHPPIDDWIAFEYAYTMMALFWDHVSYNEFGAIDADKTFYNIARQAQKFVSSANTEQSYYNIFLAKLSLPNANTLYDLAGWRLFLSNSQDKKVALGVLKMAVEIENLTGVEGLKRAPKDLAEAKILVVKASYKRATEDWELAALCYQYKVHEADFDRCLDYIYKNQPGKSNRHKKWLPSAAGWPKKDLAHDNIPNILVEGEASAHGYYLLKLPADDKRGLIIGNITHCCETLGGFSESAVRDALQRPDNGRYVILKAQHKSETAAPYFPLDERRYKIVGQSYAWRSLSGGLCLDSLECLSGQVPDHIAHSLLEKFARIVINTNPEVRFVTLGKGGKTPLNLFPIAHFSEKMRQGYQDHDSLEQYLIDQKHMLDKQLYQQYFGSEAFEYLNYISAFFENRDEFHQAIIEFAAQVNTASLQLKRLKFFKDALLAQGGVAGLDINKLLPQNNSRLAEKDCPLLELLLNLDSGRELLHILSHCNLEKRSLVINKIATEAPEILIDFIKNYAEHAFLIEQAICSYNQVELKIMAESLISKYCQFLQELTPAALTKTLGSFPVLSEMLHQHSRRPYQVMLSRRAFQPELFSAYVEALCQLPKMPIKKLYQLLSTAAEFQHVSELLAALPPSVCAEAQKLFVNWLLAYPFTALEFFQECSAKGLNFYDEIYDIPVGSNACYLEEAARYKYVDLLASMPPEQLQLFFKHYPFLNRYMNNLFAQLIDNCLKELPNTPSTLKHYFDFCYIFCKKNLLISLRKIEHTDTLEHFLSHFEFDISQRNSNLEEEMSALSQCRALNHLTQTLLTQDCSLINTKALTQSAAEHIDKMTFSELIRLLQKYPQTAEKIIDHQERLRELLKKYGFELEMGVCLILTGATTRSVDNRDNKQLYGRR